MLQLVLCQNRWLAAHNYYLERTVLQSFLAYNEQGIDTACKQTLYTDRQGQSLRGPDVGR